MNATLGVSARQHEATGRGVYLHFAMLSASLLGEREEKILCRRQTDLNTSLQIRFPFYFPPAKLCGHNTGLSLVYTVAQHISTAMCANNSSQSCTLE